MPKIKSARATLPLPSKSTAGHTASGVASAEKERYSIDKPLRVSLVEPVAYPKASYGIRQSACSPLRLML